MKELINKLTKTNAGYGISVIRVVVGITFMLHGAQKLFGVLGGGGLEGTAKFMSSLGLEPSSLMAFLAGSGEFFGGLLLILGLLSRPAALLTAIVSLVALFTVHISKGYFMSTGGSEYILVLLAASVAIMIEGAGRCSIDKIINKSE